jgi:hypothetical protein
MKRKRGKEARTAAKNVYKKKVITKNIKVKV